MPENEVGFEQPPSCGIPRWPRGDFVVGIGVDPPDAAIELTDLVRTHWSHQEASQGARMGGAPLPEGRCPETTTKPAEGAPGFRTFGSKSQRQRKTYGAGSGRGR